MRYDMTRPCTDCPFLEKYQYGYTVTQLQGYSSGEFACHKTAELQEDANGCGKFVAQTDSVHCAGALIYLEKREAPHQMMRICERLGAYDRRKLDMEAKVR